MRLAVHGRTRIWAFLTVAVLSLGLGWIVVDGKPAAPARATVVRQEGASAPAPARPQEVVDPLVPERPAALDRDRKVAEDWVRARPAEAFQYSLDSRERGGVEPCGTPAPADARERQRALGNGQLYLPVRAHDANGRFDLVIHLHGGEPVLREIAASAEPFVLYTHTLGLDQSYATLFSGAELFGALIERIAAAVTERSGRPARVDRVAVSAWSAGFEGVRALLHQPEDARLDAVLLIDGLHAPRKSEVLAARMAPFIEFARRAERGEKFMLVTHSSIPTEGYASTTETAHHLLAEVGARPLAVRRDDGFGLSLVELFSRGDLHVRGYAGNDKADHCAQLFLMRRAFTALGRRWAAGR